ncbi:MAG: hypothetical protein QW795_06615 [Candidatus Bathyarchaeia archaeon]
MRRIILSILVFVCIFSACRAEENITFLLDKLIQLNYIKPAFDPEIIQIPSPHYRMLLSHEISYGFYPPAKFLAWAKAEGGYFHWYLFKWSPDYDFGFYLSENETDWLNHGYEYLKNYLKGNLSLPIGIFSEPSFLPPNPEYNVRVVFNGLGPYCIMYCIRIEAYWDGSEFRKSTINYYMCGGGNFLSIWQSANNTDSELLIYYNGGRGYDLYVNMYCPNRIYFKIDNPVPNYTCMNIKYYYAENEFDRGTVHLTLMIYDTKQYYSIKREFLKFYLTNTVLRLAYVPDVFNGLPDPIYRLIFYHNSLPQWGLNSTLCVQNFDKFLTVCPFNRTCTNYTFFDNCSAIEKYTFCPLEASRYHDPSDPLCYEIVELTNGTVSTYLMYIVYAVYKQGFVYIFSPSKYFYYETDPEAQNLSLKFEVKDFPRSYVFGTFCKWNLSYPYPLTISDRMWIPPNVTKTEVYFGNTPVRINMSGIGFGTYKLNVKCTSATSWSEAENHFAGGIYVEDDMIWEYRKTAACTSDLDCGAICISPTHSQRGSCIGGACDYIVETCSATCDETTGYCIGTIEQALELAKKNPLTGGWSLARLYKVKLPILNIEMDIFSWALIILLFLIAFSVGTLWRRR